MAMEIAIKFVTVSLCVIILSSKEINSHGRLMEPVHRGSAWRKGFKSLKNYDDNANFCGGFQAQYTKNGGKCGLCGDDYSEPRPRSNENGGKYGTGIIVRRYRPGEIIKLEVEITANHLGYFEFSLCPLNSSAKHESERCFDAVPLYLENGRRRYPLSRAELGLLRLKAVLPRNVLCEHCVLRWHYHCGNNWGFCRDGTGRLGCGNQETFRTCSDVSILL